MGFFDKKDNSSPQGGEFDLNKLEIEILLNIIKNNSFMGAQLEDIYNVVYKLQQQYVNKQ
jgi:hypothetical protein